MGLSLVFTLIYIKFMDWCAFWLSWVMIGVIFVALTGAGIYALMYRNDKIDDNGSYEDTSQAKWLLAFAWVVLIMAGLYLLCMLCKLNSLRVAVAVIETAGDYFADTKRILFVPALYFFIAIVFLGCWVMAVICVASIGPITVNNV